MIILPIEKPPDDCSYCWRGVSIEGYIIGKTVDWQAFCPKKEDIVIENWLGVSVNWDLNNNDDAVQELLTRKKKKNGEKQFKGGAVRIPRIEIDRIIGQYEADKEMTYELRNDNDENEYHGNLLYGETLNQAVNKRRTICGALTKVVDDSRRQENQDA